MNTRALLLLVLTLLPLGSAAAAPPSILPYDQVEAGMKGTGRTTFDGTEIASAVVNGDVVEIDLSAREGRHPLRRRPGG